jgi:nitrate/TMAO reductase-like tetraheme cytochrome c subunit
MRSIAVDSLPTDSRIDCLLRRRSTAIRSFRGLILMAIGLFVGACHPFDDLRSSATSVPAAERCGECHVEIFEEWRDSPHARAFSSPQFLARTDGGSVDRCVSCHAPGPVRVEESIVRPTAGRVLRREDGVTCNSCHHLEAGHGENGDDFGVAARMIGPHATTALVEPHPIDVRAEWFHDSALCGRCHEDTYRELSEHCGPASSESCQSCHMRPVSRKVTQSTGFVSKVLVAFEESVDGRRHDFNVGAALESIALADGLGIADVELSAGARSTIVVLRNRLPHAIPTGRFGAHEIRVTIYCEGEILAAHTFVAQGSRALSAGAELVLEIHPRPEAREVEIVWERPSKGNGSIEPYMLDRRVVVLPPRAAPEIDPATRTTTEAIAARKELP